jgi:hypothetical protein
MVKLCWSCPKFLVSIAARGGVPVGGERMLSLVLFELGCLAVMLEFAYRAPEHIAASRESK